MALILTIKLPASLWRAGSVYERTVMNSLPPGLGINRLNSPALQYQCLQLRLPFSWAVHQPPRGWWREDSGGSSCCFTQSSPTAKWVPRRAHVARGAPLVLRGLCYALWKKELSQEQMIATADKRESSTESVASAWLLSTAVARETDVSLMETRISENFHLPRFHRSQQPFLWKQ